MVRSHVLVVAGSVIMLAAVAGCGKQESGNAGASLGTARGTAAGVSWAVPKRWTAMPARMMRVATYGVPSSEGAEGAECVVSFFGTGQGGDVAGNISRWVGQFEGAGQPAQSEKEINGISVTTVEIAGTYLSPGGPMMESQGKKENYRLLGAIISAPEGMVFFKLTGPAAVVASAEEEFSAMLGSVARSTSGG